MSRAVLTVIRPFPGSKVCANFLLRHDFSAFIKGAPRGHIENHPTHTAQMNTVIYSTSDNKHVAQENVTHIHFLNSMAFLHLDGGAIVQVSAFRIICIMERI